MLQCYSAAIWQHFVLNNVLQNNRGVYKFHYANGTTIWQHCKRYIPVANFVVQFSWSKINQSAYSANQIWKLQKHIFYAITDPHAEHTYYLYILNASHFIPIF